MLAVIGAISVTAHQSLLHQKFKTLGILSRMTSFETLGFSFLFVLTVQQANPARKMPQGSFLGLVFFSVCLNSVLLTETCFRKQVCQTVSQILKSRLSHSEFLVAEQVLTLVRASLS